MSGPSGAPCPAHAYARLRSLAAAAHHDVREGHPLDRQLRPVRQTLSQVIDALASPAFAARLAALTASPAGADPLAAHATHVAVLSLLMGRLLGLSRARLADLGFAALHHDVGRAATGRFPKLPPAVVETPEDHVVTGLRLALAASAAGSDQLARLVVIHEHHRMREGYPPGGLHPPHPYTRLVAAADAFDKLESGTPWRPAASPAQALRALQQDPRRHDPVAVGLLRDVLGARPRGTVVELREHRATAVVLEGGARRGHLPLVRRLSDRALIAVEHPDEVAGELPQDAASDWRALVVG